MNLAPCEGKDMGYVKGTEYINDAPRPHAPMGWTIPYWLGRNQIVSGQSRVPGL